MKKFLLFLFIGCAVAYAGGADNMPPPATPIVVETDKPNCGCPCPKR